MLCKVFQFAGCMCHIMALCPVSSGFTHGTSFLYSALSVTHVELFLPVVVVFFLSDELLLLSLLIAKSLPV